MGCTWNGLTQTGSWFWHAMWNASIHLQTHVFSCSIFSVRQFDKKVSNVKEVFTLFAKELREKFEWNQLLLTSSFVGEKQFLFETFDYPVISECFDFMQFSLHEYDPPILRFSIEHALESRSVTDLMNVIENLMKLGVPSTKVLIETIFMGIELDFALRTTTHLTYYQICHKLAHRGWFGSRGRWQTDFHSVVGLAVAVNSRTSNAILFENGRGIANKIRFAVEHNLAGTLISCVNTDDYLGECGIGSDTYADYKDGSNASVKIPRRKSETFPLLHTVNEAFLVASDDIKQQPKLKINEPSVLKVQDAEHWIVFEWKRNIFIFSNEIFYKQISLPSTVKLKI